MAEKEEINKIKEKLKKCEEERNEYLAGWQRERANFLNYKKEEAQRLKEFLEYANQELIEKILVVLDSFDMAKKEIKNHTDKENKILQGFLHIESQLKDILRKEGLERIDVKIGGKFDPRLHEAVGMVETDRFEEGTIVEVVQNGYKFKNNILRVPKVKVAK